MSFLLNAGASLYKARLRKGGPVERFDGAELSYYDTVEAYAAWIWFLGYLVLLAIAVAVAVWCKAGLRDYAVVILDPWIYLMIRAAVPCVSSK